MAILGSLEVQLKLISDAFVAGIRDAKKEADAFAKEMKPLKEAMTDIGASMTAAGVAILGTLTALTLKTADYGDALNDARQRTGIAAEQLSKLGYAAQLSGTDFEGLSTGVKFLSKNMEAAINGGKQQAEAFERLGLSVKDLKDAHGDVNAIMLKVADRFKELPDGAEKSAAAMGIFGKAGATLIPLLNEGSDGIKAMGDEATRLGLVMSGETAKASDAFNDHLSALKGSLEGVGISIGTTLLPIINDFIVAATNVVVKVREWADAHPELVKLVAALAVAITGAGGLLLGMAGVLAILPALTTAFVALTGPIGLVVAAVGALIAAFTLFPKFREIVIQDVLKPLTEALGFLGSILKTVGEAVVELATGKPGSAMKTLGGTFSKALDTATEAADFFDDTLKAITVTSAKNETEVKKSKTAYEELTATHGKSVDAMKSLQLALDVQEKTLKAEHDLLVNFHPIQLQFNQDLLDASKAAIDAAASQRKWQDAVDAASASIIQASYNTNQMQKDFDSIMMKDPGVHIAEGFGKAEESTAEYYAALEKASSEVKDSAGKVFDDLFTKGENVLTSFKTLFEGIGLSLGRTLFENVTAQLFAPLQKAFDDFFTGLLESTGIKSFLSKLGDKLGGLVSGIFGGGGSAASAAGGVASAVEGAGGTASSAVGGAASAGAGLTGSLISAAGGILGGVISALGSARQEGTLNAIEFNTRSTYIEIRDMMDGHLNWILNLEQIIADRIHDELMFPLVGILEAMQNLPSNLAAAFYASLPKYQQGTSFVPQTGPAILHKGEQIIPAGQSSGSVNVYIENAYGDVKDFANRIAREISNQVRYGGTQLYASSLKT